MSKILYIYEHNMPTVSITRDVMSNLKGYPDIQVEFIQLTKLKINDVDRNDIIVFIRPDNYYSSIIAKKAMFAGHLVITFCDDDLLNLPDDMPTIPWRKNGLINTLKNSDVIWSSSRYIAQKYKEFTKSKRFAVSDTIVESSVFSRGEIKDQNKKDDKIKIVYAAAPSHSKLFETYISPIIPKLFNQYGNRISMTFVGVHPKVDCVECEYIQSMPLMEYREFMIKQRFDIGVAPLMENDFSKCKYFNKFLEYSTQGIMGLYSNTEPYTYVIKDKENGLLVNNTPDAWYKALCMAIDNYSLRKKCLFNAIEYIKEKHSEEYCIRAIISNIPEINSKSKNNYNNCESFRFNLIIYRIMRLFDDLYLFFFFLKRIGLMQVVKKIYKHFIILNNIKEKEVKTE